MRADLPDANGSKLPPERYSYAHRAGSNFMAQRTAQSSAAFLEPYLNPGMRLLDAGCGPGTITVGLAEIVSPAQVVGIDSNLSDVERARETAAEKCIANASFEEANIYEIPYPDNSFDAVSLLGVLSHLKSPIDALIEIRRVLRPGGLVGVNKADFGGALLAPDDPLLLQSIELICKVMQFNGGDPFSGRYIRKTLSEAEFVGVQGSGSVRCYATSDSTADYAPLVSGLVRGVADQAIEFGLINTETVQDILSAWQEWGNNPEAFFLLPWCEALGWKE